MTRSLMVLLFFTLLIIGVANGQAVGQTDAFQDARNAYTNLNLNEARSGFASVLEDGATPVKERTEACTSAGRDCLAGRRFLISIRRGRIFPSSICYPMINSGRHSELWIRGPIDASRSLPRGNFREPRSV